ncbi:MAG: hypothetical protein AAFU64_07330, partial [Bacteroidota bacterium]
MNRTFNLSKLLILSLSFFCFISVSQAQQWNGNNNPNDPIWRNGNVWIGVNSSIRPFHVRGEKNVFQIDRDRKDPGFGITRYNTGFQQVWKSFYFYVEGNGVDDGRFIIADWHDQTSGPSDPRFVINNRGLVGINTLNPTAWMHVKGNAGLLNLEGSNHGYIQFFPFGAGAGRKAWMGFGGANVQKLSIINEQNARLTLGTNNLERLTILGDGRMGLNTTSMIGSSDFVLKSIRTTGYGGMYVDVAGEGTSEQPFYGYAVDGNSRAWHYFDEEDDTWKLYNNGDRLFVKNNGFVGINKENPAYPLEISSTSQVGIQYNGPQGTTYSGAYMNGGRPFYGYKVDNAVKGWHYMDAEGNFRLVVGSERLKVTPNGRVGIGTPSTVDPAARLHLYSSDATTVFRIQSSRGFGSGRIEFWSDPRGSTSEWRPGAIQSQDNGNFTGALAFYTNGSGSTQKTSLRQVMRLVNGRVGIGTSNPSTALHVIGTTTTSVLTITGGADIAEPFETTEEKTYAPGTIMVIDEANPGKLKISESAYDHKVAGVISGAE